MIFAIAATCASLGVMLIGIWVHLFLIKKHWTSYWYYIAAGMIFGVALSVLMSHGNGRGHGDYWFNYYAICPFTLASAIGLRAGLGKLRALPQSARYPVPAPRG